MEIAAFLHKVPHLVKLGITMEYKDTMNRTCRQLAKNLDRRKWRMSKSVSVVWHESTADNSRKKYQKGR